MTKMDRRAFLRASGVAALYAAAPAWLAACGAPHAAAALASPDVWAAPAPAAGGGQAQMAHLLSRITYGPRPGDVERAAREGWDSLLERQLHPEQIDDSALDARLAAFRTLSLGAPELVALLEDSRRRRRDAKASGQAAPAEAGPLRAAVELQAAALLRAIESERQLLEIMVDLWSNHLSIFIGKGPVRVLKTVDDREAVRPHALGTFRDLLLASAKSPAMLVYLDNASSTRPLGGRGGVNENYGRELLELHTVGADAGYTQDDVVAVARALTGWTVGRRGPDAGTFRFAPALHDAGEKRVALLGLTLPAGGGQEEGELLLARLAEHPRTAGRVARKLAAAFVSDSPPEALVARAAQAYLASGTDIRATLLVILRSEEFRAAAGQKVKLPLRLLASAARALGASPGGSPAGMLGLLQLLRSMGQPPFGWPSPNGYPQAGAAWLTAGGMASRWAAAMRLAAGDVRGVRLDLSALAPPAPVAAPDLARALGARLLPGGLPADAEGALAELCGGRGATLDAEQLAAALPLAAGVLLASPAFQVH